MLNFLLDFGKTEFVILLSMLPGIILGIIIYKKDIIEKEPLKLLFKLIFYGVLAAGVSLFFELNLQKFLDIFNINGYLYIFINSFFIIAVSEELTKWFLTCYVCWNNKEFNYRYDAIVYSSFLAIGFASIENLIAIFANNFDLILAIKRGLITVSLHVFLAILSGYYLGYAKMYDKRNWNRKYKKNLFSSIIIPILVHGIFDFLLFMSSNTSMLISILLIIYLYITSYIKITKVSKKGKIK